MANATATATVTQTSTATQLPTGTWALDTVHSTVGFGVKHLGINTYRGQFPGIEGHVVTRDGRITEITGTAQIDIENGITQPWFIAFAPLNNPRVAIAVTVERTEGGFGGTVAAPIAKDVMETLLR